MNLYGNYTFIDKFQNNKIERKKVESASNTTAVSWKVCQKLKSNKIMFKCC